MVVPDGFARFTGKHKVMWLFAFGNAKAGLDEGVSITTIAFNTQFFGADFLLSKGGRCRDSHGRFPVVSGDCCHSRDSASESNIIRA